MNNGLKQVSALRVDSQVLGGEPTPPSLGVNDYTFRVVPGSADSVVNSVPPAIDEIVTGSRITLLNNSANPLLIRDDAGRYGVQLRNSIGYGYSWTDKQYYAGFAVCKIPNNFRGDFFLNLGPFSMFIDTGGNFINQDANNRRNTHVSGAIDSDLGVFTVFKKGTQTVSVNPTGNSNKSDHSVGTKSWFVFGPKSVAEARKAMYNGVTLYDAVLYDRELSDDEILRVRQSLQNIWGTKNVGNISW